MFHMAAERSGQEEKYKVDGLVMGVKGFRVK